MKMVDVIFNGVEAKKGDKIDFPGMKDFFELYDKDPVIHRIFQVASQSPITFEQMLILCLQAISKDKENIFNDLVKMKQGSAEPVIVPSFQMPANPKKGKKK